MSSIEPVDIGFDMFQWDYVWECQREINGKHSMKFQQKYTYKPKFPKTLLNQALSFAVQKVVKSTVLVITFWVMLCITHNAIKPI